MAYRVETLILSNGERFPMLIVSETGMPDFYPTLYTSTSLRLLRAANSIVAVLRAIHVMYLAGKQMGINFQSRMLEGKLLSIGEIERLSAEIRKSTNELRREPDEQDAAFLAALDSQNVAKIKKNLDWKRVRKSIEQVNPEFGGARLSYVHDYLKWLSGFALTKLREGSSERLCYIQERDEMFRVLQNRTKDQWGTKRRPKREALSDEARAVLFDVISPASPHNPWRKPHTRMRNCVMVCVAIQTGLRRGELAGIKIQDIDVRLATITVRRRHDDPEDERKSQPVAKTQERTIAIGGQLVDLINRYRFEFRDKVPDAKKTPFLLVDEHNGRPLSLSAINSVFQDMQRASPLLTNIDPHTLRHTFCHDIGKESDRKGWSEAEEAKIMKEIFGWSQKSKMPERYGARRIREKAAAATLAAQANMPAVQGLAELNKRGTPK